MTLILIVGAGTFGLSLAASLISRSIYSPAEITIVDRFPPGENIDAASYDLNKIIRMDYGDPLYAALSKRAIEMWALMQPCALDEVHTKQLGECFHQVGLAFLGPKEHPFVQDAFKIARELGIPDLKELRDNAAIRDVLGVSEDDVDNQAQSHGYFNPWAGWSDSGRAIKIYADYLVSLGVNFVTATVESLLTQNGTYIGVLTKDGQQLRAALTVVAAGAWTDSIVDTQGQILATAQCVGIFNMGTDNRFANRPVVFDLSDGFYAFPSKTTGELKCAIDGSGFTKIVKDPSGRNISIPVTNLNPTGRPCVPLPKPSVNRLRDGLSRFVSKFLGRSRKFDRTRLCWYTDSIDTDFLIAPLPLPGEKMASTSSGAFLATGGSGHGFKFLPLIGDAIIDVMQYYATEEKCKTNAFERFINPRTTTAKCVVPVKDLVERWKWRPDKVIDLRNQGRIGTDGFVLGKDHDRGRVDGRTELSNVEIAGPEAIVLGTSKL